jgi:hypothetical protein
VPGDYQRTDRLDNAVPSFGRAAGPPGLACWPTWVAWVIIPGEGQQRSIAENMAGKEHDAWSG